MMISCEGLIGENGVVVDNETGMRIEGVSVKMNSDLGSRETFTDTIGFFHATKFVGCGFLGNCDEDFSITFEKDGYEPVVITNNYYNSGNAEFVTPGTKDTLIIKLMPN